MIGLGQDVRILIRQTRRRPVWTLSVVAVLALGIGANTAMYAGFDAWVTRPLPFEDPERLFLVNESQTLRGDSYYDVSPATLQDIERRQTSFETLQAFDEDFFNIADASDPIRVRGCRVTHGLLPMLGIEPVLGRHFGPEEDLPGQPSAVVIVSHRLWRERYQADPAVLGTSIRIDGRVHQIVGVFPEGFRFPSWSEIWLPLGVAPEAFGRDRRWLDVVGRLRPETSVEQAQSELARIAAEISGAHPDTNEAWSLTLHPLRDLWVPRVIEVALTASMGAALAVLLIVCANVASLMLARAWSRSRENALRRALGASRWRSLQQTLVETTGIALASGGVGLILAAWWIDWMYALAPIDPPYLFSMNINAGIVLYTLLVSLVAGLACGLTPLYRSTGAGLHEELRGGRGSLTTGIRTSRMRSALVVAELALSTALSIGAMLMAKSFIQQRAIDPGYQTEHILVTQLTLSGFDFEDEKERSRFLERVQTRLLSSPLVSSVGTVNALPSSQGYLPQLLEAEGRPAERDEGLRASLHAVAGSYLQTLEIRLLAGRYFTEAELRDGGDVAIVSESLARQLWGDAPLEGLLGQRLRRLDGESGPWLRLVGVVENVLGSRDMVPRQDVPRHQFYRPYGNVLSQGVTLTAASRASKEEVAELTRSAIRSNGVPVPISEVLTMREAIVEVQWVTRFFSEQLLAYGLMALLIAAVGLYGLIVDSVGQRAKEFAVRMAIGARHQDIVSSVVVEALKLGALGILTGLGIGAVGTRLGASMLLGVSPSDPIVLSAVVLVLTSVIALASYLPARRAASLDAAEMLRSE